MKCPFCHSDETQVIDSRDSDDGDSIRRRRKCAACNKRFTTYETVELRMPQVVKHNGMRSEFDEEKWHGEVGDVTVLDKAALAILAVWLILLGVYPAIMQPMISNGMEPIARLLGGA